MSLTRHRALHHGRAHQDVKAVHSTGPQHCGSALPLNPAPERDVRAITCRDARVAGGALTSREGHIARLRERVGSDLIIVPSVSVCLWDDQRLLLAHHPATGVWSTPGGAVEPDETVSAACMREAKEELDVAVDVEGVAAVLGPDEIVYPNGDRTAYVTTAFACRSADAPQPDRIELDQLRWVREADVTSMNIAPWLRPWVVDLIRWRPGDPVLIA